MVHANLAVAEEPRAMLSPDRGTVYGDFGTNTMNGF
jgi:hypothetical protein